MSREASRTTAKSTNGALETLRIHIAVILTSVFVAVLALYFFTQFLICFLST